MRFLNDLLYVFIFLLLFATVRVFGQTQGNAPAPTDAVNSDTPGQPGPLNVLVTPENLATGDTVFVAYSQDAHTPGGSPNCGPGPYTISDSSSNTWTSYTPFITTRPTFEFGAQMYCSVITTPGADTITVTPTASACSKATMFWRFPASQNITCTLDGSQQVSSLSHSNSPSVQTYSTTNVTSFNGDALLSFTICTFCVTFVPTNTQTITTAAGGYFSFVNLMNAGIAGSYSPTISYIDGGLAFTTATIAVKTNGINIVTTALADCALGVTCTQNLQAVGGSGAYTWSITSGSVSGMSINASTGVFADTGAGPTAQGSFSLTFHVTDGTVSANKTLTQVVGSNFRTPALIDSAFNLTFDNGGATLTPFATSVSCGESVLMMMNNADDTHYGEGWLQAISGAANYYAATVGGIAAPITRVPLFGGTYRGPVYGILYGPFTNGGTFTVAGINNQGSSSALNLGFYRVSNTQSAVDTAAFTAKTVVADSTVAVSTTTLEPNEFVASLSSGYQSVTATLNSPFTLDYTDAGLGTGSLFGHALVSSPSSITSTANITSHQGCSPNCTDDYAAYLVALRPRLPMAACGEIVPIVRHKAQIY